MNGEDGDLALRLGDAQDFAQITDPVTFAYREHDTNATADLAKTLEGVWHKVRTEIAMAIRAVRLVRENDGASLPATFAR